MAKIRVYELARDLNLTNKELISKMKELDIIVKSHMSSLEDETIDFIKTNFSGKPAQNVEETRVKPTVIRRRRKHVSEKEEPIETVATQEEDLEQLPSTDVETPELEEEIGEEPTGEDSVELKKESVQDEIELEETELKAARETAPPAEIIADANDQQAELQIEAQQENDESLAEPVIEKEAEPEKEAEIAAKGGVETIEPQSKVALKKVREKSKPKKSESAKIIQLPDGYDESAPQKEKQVRDQKPITTNKVLKTIKPEEKSEDQADTSPGEVTGKRKKGKKGEPEPTQDKKFFKKKISFRRKEVVEGAALYSEERTRVKKGKKGQKAKPVVGQKTQITVPKAIKRRIKVDETISLADLAKRMGIKANEMIAKLMTMGVMATVNQTIDFETASLVATEFGYEVEKAAFAEEKIIVDSQDAPGQLMERPPVVTIMGHVDHGKTSLLDVIRETRVTDFEAGGITQHIGAYYVETKKGQIVFLDTPGHEAFTTMRARGAKVTDIVILVVAADDGVMPQTIEAINHSKAAGVPIIVAINKMDKQGADPDRIFREFAEQGLVPEDWGGDVIFVKVSAKLKEGIDELLEMVLLQAEILELKANPHKLATGHVVEAKLDSGRGPVATVLINNGTLRAGDPVVCGVHYGRVRALLDDRGGQIESAGPSMPVEILGLSGVPVAGDELITLEDEKNARQVSMHRIQKQRAVELAKTSRLSLEGLFEKLKEGDVKDLNLIIKADVHGSIEALKESLTNLSTDEVQIKVVHDATGTITESDISLAAVSNAIIIGFNVRPSMKVQDLAQEENVDIRYYDVIYGVIKDIKDAMVGLMESTFEERVLGTAEVREIFHVPKIGTIAGSYVTDGKILRGKNMRVLRDGVVSYDGKIQSLRRFKDDVKEVLSGYECGIGVENFNDIKVGDTLECYLMDEIKPKMT